MDLESALVYKNILRSCDLNILQFNIRGGFIALMHNNSAFLNFVNRRHIHILVLFDTQCIAPTTLSNYTHYYISRWNHRSGGIAVSIHRSLHTHIQCTRQSQCLILMSQTLSLCCVCTYIHISNTAVRDTILEIIGNQSTIASHRQIQDIRIHNASSSAKTVATRPMIRLYLP